MSENEKALPLEDVGVEEAETGEVAVVSRSDDYVLVYSNFAQCGFTAWDIRINFGLVGISSQGEPTLTEQAAVVLTPQMAKALVAVINGNVKLYEKQNGEVQMPRAIIEESARRVAQAKAQAKGQPKAEAQPKDSKSKE